MRASSSHTTYSAWWAMPCASVSANRTRTSWEKANPSTRATVHWHPMDDARALAELIVADGPVRRAHVAPG